MHMYRTLKLGLLLGALAEGVAAEPVFAPLQTPAGLLQVVEAEDGFSRYLTLGSRPYLMDAGYAYVALYDRQADMVLVQVASGGNACPSLFVWVNSSAAAPGISDAFGTCAEEVEVRREEDALVVRMASGAADEGFVDFVYDGLKITREVAGQEPSISPPAAGAAPWIGAYPHDLFRGSDWRAALVALMGEADYVRGGQIISLSTPMEPQGDWVVGRGCDKSECDTRRGAIAINRADGRLLVALRQGEDAQIWGDARGPLPTAIAEIVR